VEVVVEAEVLKTRENERVADMAAIGCLVIVDRNMQSNEGRLVQSFSGVSVRVEYIVMSLAGERMSW
jgi:hypothetical protein